MKLTELKPGLWRWTAAHPEWKPSGAGSGWDRQVGCLRYEPTERDEALVLVDPLAPAGQEADAFWTELEQALHHAGRTVAVVLVNRFHSRSAEEVVRRFKDHFPVEIWAHRDAVDHWSFPVQHAFGDADALPGGLKAYTIEGLCPGESVLHLPRFGALIFADAVLGAPGGGLSLPPANWALDQDLYHQRFKASVRRLLDLEFDSLLLSHGEPVLQGGKRKLQALLQD